MGTRSPHTIQGVGFDGSSPLVGEPDGPLTFIPELGMEVGTFIDPREDLRQAKDSGMSWLMHHVPRNRRGYYKPESYPEEFKRDNKEFIQSMRVDHYSMAMCTARTIAGNDCMRRAVNRSGKCQAHGGKLHPLDKVSDARRASMGNELVAALETRPENVARMTRWQKLISGVISVDDLDDEEVARGQCRDEDGRFSGKKPGMVPADLQQKLIKSLFARGDAIMRQSYLVSMETLSSIASGTAYEPADRIKAATYLIERLAGKTPDVVVHAQDKPFEMVLSGIAGGSRAASRMARGVADEEEILEAQAVIDLDALSDDEEETNERPDWGVPTRGDDGASGADRSGSGVHDGSSSGVDPDYDPDDPIQNPYAGLEDEPDPILDPIHEARVDVPPGEPEARQIYERNKEDERKEAIHARKVLSEALKNARRKREYARSQGLEDAEDFPYTATHKLVNGEHTWKFTPPRLRSKRRGNDDFRHKI